MPHHDSVGIRNLTHLSEFTGLIQLEHDIRSSDELAIDIELRNGGPRAVHLNTLADVWVS